MVKSLLIRQVFVVVDLALALLVAFVIYVIAAQQMRAQPEKQGVDTPPVQNASDVPKLRKVGPLSSYGEIIESNIFGKAGATATEAASTQVDPSFTPPPPTLTLHATAASDEPDDPLATAVIENSASPSVQKVATYYHGQPVTGDLYLKEVYPRKVVLENRQKNSLSELVMPDATEQAKKPTMAMARNNLRGMQQPGPSDGTQLSRDEVAQELSSYDYTDVVNSLNPQMAQDDNGNVTGITSENFASIPLASKIGLQNGDVVNTVNGIKIDSDQRLIEIFNKFQNASTFRLGITRNGAPVMLTFKLQ